MENLLPLHFQKKNDKELASQGMLATIFHNLSSPLNACLINNIGVHCLYRAKLFSHENDTNKIVY